MGNVLDPPSAQIVCADHLVVSSYQGVTEVRADETRPASNESTHISSLLVSLGHRNAGGHRTAYSKTADRPTGGFPLVVGQGVTSIEQAGLTHDRAEHKWVDVPVLGPLGQVEDDIRVGARVLDVTDVFQLGERRSCVSDRCRVVDSHSC